MEEGPPASLLGFYELIKRTPLGQLFGHPNAIQPPECRSSMLAQESMLRLAPQTMEQNISNYPMTPRFQEALFEFRGGFCPMCPQSVKHIHGVQGGGVFNIEGMPGVSVYPRLFVEKSIERRLVDELLVGEEKLSTLPPVAASGNAVIGEPKPLPKSVATFFAGLFDLREQSGALQISNAAYPSDLKPVNREGGPQLLVSLGCDCILVLGSARGDDEPVFDQPANYYERTNSKLTNPQEHGGPFQGVARRTGYAAILLRSGDALTLSEEAIRTWIGIAQVLEGTFPFSGKGRAHIANRATGHDPEAFHIRLETHHVLLRAS
ncbi:uncharacterized protein RHO25_011044 [Cercospora beticola]|uniref:Uncharacterized protein n=1 Tax=Cercospora beticola TaxID=122368 RepID=A0ABZ0P3F6_CERBT|nr:hypothetical protein RHO25_011044 [Cercospora beticola]